MIKELTGRIEEEIKALNLPGHLPELYSPIVYTLENGGKRIRPLLLMTSARMFGVEDKQSIHQALAVEIFHNFTLVHDDIMDNAPLRRGKASVFKKWDQNTAILSGDVMFSISMQEAVKCDKAVLPDVLNTFLDMTVKVCEGQQMDMNFEIRNDVRLEEYIHMIELKTAYLLAGSLKIGAILGKENAETAQLMFDYGMKTGTAFQLMDDYLDAFGDPKKFGKQVGGDILAGKKTFLHIESLNKLKDEDRVNFEKLASNSSMNPADKIKGVKAYFEKSGAKDQLKLKAETLLKEAKLLLTNIDGDQRAKQELINLTDQLTQRDK